MIRLAVISSAVMRSAVMRSAVMRSAVMRLAVIGGNPARAVTRLNWSRAVLPVLFLALAACASSGRTNVTSGAKPTVAAQADLPQAPQSVPSMAVTQVPLGPPGTPPVQTGPLKVGLLLPLTGNGSNIGPDMLNAAQMALFDLGEDRFELLPRDTKGAPAEAAASANQLVADGVRLILGPLFTNEVAAVKSAVRGAPVSFLAFTNDWQRAGDGTFVMGLVPADQVVRVVSYAQMRGVQRLAVLAPRDPFGDAVTAAARDSAQTKGLVIVREERYGTDNSDMAAAVARLASNGSRPAAFEARKRDLAGRTDEASRAALARLQVEETQGASGFGFDALLIAQGGDRLRALLPMLANNRIDTGRVRLLGTSQWGDDPTLANLPGLAGAWYAASAPQTRADFESRFGANYHHKPQRLAALAYDATALAAVLARTPATSRFDTASLTNPSGFAGVDGIFRLRGDGLVERGLAVIEIAPEGSRVIDDAPTSFQALTN
ncbi:MAG: penicillin-binding protein activator [Rhodospirillaceae bacterium]